MDHKKKLSVLVFLLISISLFAQNQKRFKATSIYVSKAYDITYKKPKGFVYLKSSELWKPGEKSNIGFIYDPIFQSKDGNCIIMYPSILPLISARGQATGEVKAALGFTDRAGYSQEGTTIDYGKYMTVYTDSDARQCFNADSVFIAHLPIKKAYKDRYTYCIGIYISKKDRPTLLFKLFLTEAEKHREQEYLNLLYKRIWYRNENWVFDKEIEAKANHERYCKSIYK